MIAYHSEIYNIASSSIYLNTDFWCQGTRKMRILCPFENKVSQVISDIKKSEQTLKNLPAQCAASNCFCQEFFLFLDVFVGKWDLYSFSIVLTIPSSMRTSSGVAGGERISSAPG